MPWGAVAAAVVTTVASRQAAKKGAAASAEAARTQAEGMERAAEIESESAAEQRRILEEQLGITREQFAPFLEAGTSALPELQRGFQAPEGTTLPGLENVLSQIMGGEAFQSLIGERERGVRGQLAAGGLTRSGTAVREAAAIPTDLAFELENLLFGRAQGAEAARIGGLQDLTQLGLSAAAQTGGQTGALTSAITEAMRSGAQARGAGITGAARAGATGILGGAQAQAQHAQNLMNLGGTLGSAYIQRNR